MIILCLKKLTLAVKPSMREVRYWLRIVVFSRSNRSSHSFLFSMNSLTFLYTRLSTATEFWYLRCECTLYSQGQRIWPVQKLHIIRQFISDISDSLVQDSVPYTYYHLNYYHHEWFWMVLNAKLTDLLESCCTNPKIFLKNLFFKQLPIFLYR